MSKRVSAKQTKQNDRAEQITARGDATRTATLNALRAAAHTALDTALNAAVKGEGNEPARYGSVNLSVNHIDGRGAIRASGGSTHGAERVSVRQIVESGQVRDAAAFEVKFTADARVSTQRADRNAAIVSEGMARLDTLTKWYAAGGNGKRPQKITEKHLAAAHAVKHPKYDALRAMFDKVNAG